MATITNPDKLEEDKSESGQDEFMKEEDHSVIAINDIKQRSKEEPEVKPVEKEVQMKLDDEPNTKSKLKPGANKIFVKS